MGADQTTRILITGSKGQLGKALAEYYSNATSLSKEALDISNSAQVDSFDWSQYDCIINAAAYVNADESETPEGRLRTWSVNASGVQNLVRAAAKNNILLVHISSEYVFDGSIKNHLEDEPFSPLSVYGETKAAADIVVSLLPRHYILRTTWVVGEGHNFVRTMKRLADMRIDPKVVNDQFGRLTFVEEIVRGIDHLLAKNAPFGTYNVSNSGQIKSWADIAADVFELSGHDPERVKPISTEEYKSGKLHFAPRPRYSDLDLTKIQNTGFISRDYHPLLRSYVESIQEFKV